MDTFIVSFMSRFSKKEWGEGGWPAVRQLFLYATGQLPRGAQVRGKHWVCRGSSGFAPPPPPPAGRRRRCLRPAACRLPAVSPNPSSPSFLTDTQPPAVPEELADWPTTILPPMAVGMAYSGWQQWRLERAAVYHGFGPPPAWYYVLRAFRVHDRALRGGLQFAGLAALFFGTHALTAVLRGRRSFWADGLAGGAAVGVVQARKCAAAAAVPPLRPWPQAPEPLSIRACPPVPQCVPRGRQYRGRLAGTCLARRLSLLCWA